VPERAYHVGERGTRKLKDDVGGYLLKGDTVVSCRPLYSGERFYVRDAGKIWLKIKRIGR